MPLDPSKSDSSSAELTQTVELEPSAPAAPTGERSPASLVDALIAETGTGRTNGRSLLDEFLREPSAARALRRWLGRRSLSRTQPPREALARLLSRDVARLDALLAEQVNAILHHPRFQQLEASWRGLWFLTGQAEQANELADQEGGQAKVKIRVLNMSRRELFKDLDRAIEFDQSQTFKKVYEEEFGTPGGEPYGVLIGDYEITNHPEDIDLLTKMSQVAAAAFAPFLTGAAPQLLALDDFSTLEQPVNLSGAFEHLDYLKWRAFRDSEESRFAGLLLPRTLMRLPYEHDGSRPDGFRFREAVEGPDRSRYLWGNASYAFGSVLIRAFGTSGWFAEIRGVERGVVGGGLVTGLEVHSFRTDRRGVAPKISCEVAIGEIREKELSELGFIPLCPCKDTEFSAFYTNQSAHRPKVYDDQAATANAKVSAMLQYVLCASRFAHYLKVTTRNKIGGHMSERELENYLNRWVTEYVAPDEKAPQSTKAKYPLREAQVEVREIPGSPGSFRLVMHLLPHFQLDDLTATLRLVTKLTPTG